MAKKNIFCDLAVKAILAQAIERGLPGGGATGILQMGTSNIGRLLEGFSYEEYQHQGEDLLGSYTPMSSPGTITLNADNLKGLFWHTVATLSRAGYSFRWEDLEKLAELTVKKTYWHEHFHLFTDVQRHLVSGSVFDHDLEEALAVAFSWLKIEGEHRKANSTIGKIYDPHYEEFLKVLFDYQSPGYKDWVHYPDREEFLKGLLAYINPPNADKLLANGIPVHALLEAQLDKVLEFRKNEVLIWKGKKEVNGDV